VLDTYAYSEIRFPVVEHTELFKRSIGEVTDIVEKEMYSFGGEDQNKYSLRPEGTAVCVRTGISNGLFYNKTQKLWYAGPMFRRERPQKGRYRQFHQIGAEAFGFNGPDVDAELIILSARIWKKLGLAPKLEINSIGSTQTRLAYKEALVKYFEQYKDELDADSVRRLQSNPLRILDRKVEHTQKIVKNAPVLFDYLAADEIQHFNDLKILLDDANIKYSVNPRLVRGLDYYSLTVFEWVTDKLGAQNAICSGGRYDGLVEQLGGKPCPAVGWALGCERVIELMRLANTPLTEGKLDAYFIVAADGEATRIAFKLAEQLRDDINGVKLAVNCGGGSIKAQMKRADKSGARFALILGTDELATSTIILKDLREAGEQKSFAHKELLEIFKQYLNS